MNMDNQFSKECKIDVTNNDTNKGQKKCVTFEVHIFSVKNEQKNIVRDGINTLLIAYPTLHKLKQVYTLLFPFIKKYIKITNTENKNTSIDLNLDFEKCLNATDLDCLKRTNRVIQVFIDVFINYYCKLKTNGSVIIRQKQYKYSSSNYFYYCIQSLRKIRTINNIKIEEHEILLNDKTSRHESTE